MSDLPEHVRRNREAWDRYAAEYAEPGHRTRGPATRPTGASSASPRSRSAAAAATSTAWTRSSSAAAPATCRPGWPAAARVRSASTTRRRSSRRRAASRREFGIEFPLHLGNAEQTPFPDESFDLAISEYGATIWCDPYRWIPEAARLLRPGGQLIFLVNGTILMLCAPDQDERAGRPTGCSRPTSACTASSGRTTPSVEFHLGYGDMIRLLRDNGFEVEDLVEVRPPADADQPLSRTSPLEWARRWPAEEIWKARKRA